MHWLWNIFTAILDYLGLSKKKGKIVFLGLDCAGKTTLLHLLKYNRVAQHAPTHQPTTEALSIGGITFTTYDLGGHKQARRVWKDYFPAVDAIVFLVDCADLERINESKAELEGLLRDEQISYCPILVLGNKIDKPNALSEDQLKWHMGIQHMCTGKESGRITTAEMIYSDNSQIPTPTSRPDFPIRHNIQFTLTELFTELKFFIREELSEGFRRSELKDHFVLLNAEETDRELAERLKKTPELSHINVRRAETPKQRHEGYLRRKGAREEPLTPCVPEIKEPTSPIENTREELQLIMPSPQLSLIEPIAHPVQLPTAEPPGSPIPLLDQQSLDHFSESFGKAFESAMEKAFIEKYGCKD